MGKYDAALSTEKTIEAITLKVPLDKQYKKALFSPSDPAISQM